MRDNFRLSCIGILVFAALLIVSESATRFMTAAPGTPPAKKTDPKAEPKKAEPKIPNIACETNWGTLDQKGRDFTITGGSVWVAAGRIRPDGKVELTWTYLSNGADCPAVYEIINDPMGGGAS